MVDVLRAIINGDIGEVEKWLQECENVNGVDPLTGMTPILDAILFDRVQMVEMILDAGGDPTVKNMYGEAAGHLAMRTCSPDVAEKLLEVLRPHDIDWAGFCFAGETAMSIAQSKGFEQAVIEIENILGS